MQRVTHEYIKEVIQAREEHDATQQEEQKKRIEAIKASDFKDPVVCLLHITHKAARTQAEKAVNMFLSSIKSTLHKHIPAHAQGPLIANALSTAFQFQMSVWCMIGEECVCPVQAKHSDWCGLAGVVQAIVETFPKNCALMFPSPPVPMPPKLFSSTFRPASSDEDDNDDDNTLGARVSAASTPVHPCPLLVGTEALAVLAILLPSHPPLCLTEVSFIWQVTRRRCPAVQPACPQATKEWVVEVCLKRSSTWCLRPTTRPMPTEDIGDELDINSEEVQMLKQIIKPTTGGQPSTAHKSGDKRGSTHLDGGSGSSDSSSEDLDASRGT